jgi:hypothetical protein
MSVEPVLHHMQHVHVAEVKHLAVLPLDFLEPGHVPFAAARCSKRIFDVEGGQAGQCRKGAHETASAGW